jgi:hypothetical protein
MVDWKLIREKWNEMSAEQRQKIIDLMNAKFRENTDKFTAWLKEDPDRQIIWCNYVVKPSPPAPVKVKLNVEEGTSIGEYFVHIMYDSFEVTFSATTNTQALKDYLDQGEEYIDPREQLTLQGFRGEQVEEELKKLPAPFSAGEEVKLVWTSQDITFTPRAKEWWDVWQKVYTLSELQAFDLERLKDIARLKGVKIGKDKQETINNILGITPPAPTPAPIPARPAAPPTTGELTKDQIGKLEDVFKATFMRELGRIPRDVLSEFRVEVDAIKFLPYEQAVDRIQHLAMEIIERERERAVTARLPIRERPVREGIPVGVPSPPVAPAVPPPKAEPPAVPLDITVFPRRISSAEINAFSDAFVYALYELHVDPAAYRDYFERFRDAWYSNWFSVLRAFEGMVNDIKAGKQPRYYPRPPIWKELPRDAILHLLATKVYKSIDQLIAALNMHGVFVEPEEIKEIVKREWAKTPRDSWLLVTPKEYLSETLGIPIEELPD